MFKTDEQIVSCSTCREKPFRIGHLKHGYNKLKLWERAYVHNAECVLLQMQADSYEPNVTLLGVLVQAEDKSWHVIEVYERDVDRMEAELRSQLQHIHIIAQVRSCQPTNQT